MSASVEIWIARTVPSLNVWQSLPRYRRKKINKWWVEHIHAAKQLQDITDATARRRVHVVRYCHQMMDQDNIIVKPLMDALKKNGLLVDDSPTWVDLRPVTQDKARNSKTGKPGTMIRISRAGE